MVEQLLTQPILVIAGGKAGSLWHSQELYTKAQAQKELLIIGGAAHMIFYDGEHVGTALTQLASFFEGYL